ncbi:hypothetical protein CMI42_04460 [Candidatus Pacearchaeota archaeon]|jgi:putative hydrolase of the HAD superfamily|nr:hypothetical protein [Candidatus Pacearchaeota archaeon]|tara:strand:+ start:2130 stop:2810 length:681 start_codon:yes stop_codon:yes gene_type:complete
MRIKVVIFDLDNTLHDVEPLTEIGLKQAIERMVENGLRCSVEEGLRKIKEIIKKDPKKNKFKEVVEFFGPNKEEIVETGRLIYYRDMEFDKIYPAENLKEVLDKLDGPNIKLMLLTSGFAKLQNKKIDMLKIRDYFSEIIIDESRDKEDDLGKLLSGLGVEPGEVMVVGDRIDKELKFAKELGMITTQMKMGKFKDLKPRGEDEKPDYVITDLIEVIKILENEGRK